MENFLENNNFLIEISYSLIIFLGIVGNMANILILRRKTMRKSLTFQLFFYLSIIDLTFLTQTSIEISLKYLIEIDLREFSVVFCKLNTFLSYFLMQTRNIFSMSITLSYLIEISKLSLINANNNNNVKHSSISQLFAKSNEQEKLNEAVFPFAIRIKKILLITIGILCLINFHFILFLNVNVSVESNFVNKNALDLEDMLRQENFLYDSFRLETENRTLPIYMECSPYKHEFYTYFLRNIWIWIDMIIYFLTPFTVNLISFVFIFVYIRRFNKRYSDMLKIENYKPNAHIYLKRIKNNKRIVWRLLSLNSYFFFSSLPSYVSCYFLFWSKIHLILNYLGYVLFYSNNSLNFLFYGLSSQKYRNELLGFMGIQSRVVINAKVVTQMDKSKSQLKEIGSMRVKCEEKFTNSLITPQNKPSFSW